MQEPLVILQSPLAALGAFVSTACLTPLLRSFAHWAGAVDRPDGNRKLQHKPIALLGGVAVLGGLAVTILSAAVLGAMPGSRNSIMLVAASLGILCAAGVIDDVRNLKPHWKLVAQFAAVVPLLWTGYQLETLHLFGISIELGWLGVPVTAAWIIACTNAINLIDGMDGLCSTVALCIVVGIAAIGMSAGAMHTVICAAAFAGSLLGFLIYNRPPASIYLGDAGSMVIGMALALLTMRVAKVESRESYPLVLIALMAVPLADVALAMLRRKLNGMPIWKADRGHIHHRLLDSGKTVSQGLWIVALVCLMTSIVATLSFQYKSEPIAIVGLALLAMALVRGQLMGHQEWALVQARLFRKYSDDTPHGGADLNEPALILQFRKAADPTATDAADNIPKRHAA